MSSGQAFLYAGTDLGTGQRIALKQLLAPLDADASDRHRRECDFLLRKAHGHPGIVRAIEEFADGQEQFLVEQWIDGATLNDDVARNGPPPMTVALSRLIAICRAVHYVNVQGSYFRDLNENNVMITPTGEAILIDFGGIEDCNSPRTTKLLPPGAAPEILAAYQHGRKAAFSRRTEVYALCALGYYMATGQYVPDDRNTQTLAPPSALNAQVSPGFEAAILRGLAIDPALRPADPAALRRELDALGGAVPRAPFAQAHYLPPPPPQPMMPVGAPFPAVPGRAGRPDRSRLWWTGWATTLLAPAIVLPLMRPPAIGNAPQSAQREAAVNSPNRAMSSPTVYAIRGARVNLRARPGLGSPVIGQLSAPKKVTILGESGGWYQVAAPGGIRGYVWGAYLPTDSRYRRGSLAAPVWLARRRAPQGERVLVVGVDSNRARLLLPEGDSIMVRSNAVSLSN